MRRVKSDDDGRFGDCTTYFSRRHDRSGRRYASSRTTSFFACQRSAYAILFRSAPYRHMPTRLACLRLFHRQCERDAPWAFRLPLEMRSVYFAVYVDARWQQGAAGDEVEALCAPFCWRAISIATCLAASYTALSVPLLPMISLIYGCFNLATASARGQYSRFILYIFHANEAALS